MTDWKIVKHDHRSRNGDVYEGEPIYTVVPAQPGYSVIEFDEEGGAYEQTLDMLAWLITVTPTKICGEVGCRQERPQPVTFNKLISREEYAIREPGGAVLYEDIEFKGVAEVLEYRKQMNERLNSA